ncbi:MAG TPA: replication factor C large subunit [Candidatus Nanoarchaeia archaeon]|nr:replication factor C large subunit [Candidatus Nanoarchaeia archaeon]
MKPWVEKYRPKNFEDLKGQDEAVLKTKKYIEEFNLGKLIRKTKKALVLHGPPGTGKTSLAYVMAEVTNSEIFELNASDLRDKKKLNEILRPALEQQSLRKKGKVILVDEADGISSVDRGGLTELISLIESTTYPVIITANDIWDRKLSPLRQKAELIQLKEVDYKTIKDVLFSVLRKENLFVNNNIITSIAIRAKGDIRAALNDLQSISRLIDPSIIEFHERNKEVDIFNALRLIFKGKPTPDTLKVFDSVNMPMDEIILWVEENIPAEYKGIELAKAYDRLSKVDVFRGRIYKQQYWRFLVYENALLSFGISSAKEGIKTGFTTYKRPSRILKIWMNNQKTAKMKSIAKKYAEHVHVGQKRAMKEFPIIKQIIKSSSDIQIELKLDEDELAYLNK